MSWREVKARARAAVHGTMQVPSYYLGQTPYVEDSNSEGGLKTLNVRVHTNDKALGDQAGTSLNSAERWEMVPRLIFWVAELEAAGITLARNDLISVAEGEAYNIDTVHPQDRETVTVDVTRLSSAEALGLPYPEDT